jgi:hypothetical protein
MVTLPLAQAVARTRMMATLLLEGFTHLIPTAAAHVKLRQGFQVI